MGDSQDTDVRLKMLELLYAEFRDRHDHFWNLFFRASAAVLFLEVLPFVYVNNVAVVKLGWYFPLAASAIAVAAFTILVAEYARVKWASEYIGEIRDKIGFAQPRARPTHLEAIRIGPYVYYTFLILSIAMSLVAFNLLLAK